VAWQPDSRLLFGVRALFNNDDEHRTDLHGVSEGIARSAELRLGGSLAPWQGALIDVGGRDCIKVRIPQYLSAPHLLLQSDMVWTVPNALGKTLARFYPLVIQPLPLQIPPFEIDLYWHDRFHRDPQNKWFREMVSRVLRSQQSEWE